MDWRKAVKILTISFLILNIFIAVNLYIKNAFNKRILEINTSMEMQKILKQKGIILKTELSYKGENAYWLEVASDENLIIEGHSDEIKSGINIVDMQSAEKIAEKFIINKIGMPQQAQLNGVIYNNKEKKYEITYVQQYKNFPVYNSFIKVIISNDGKITLKKTWLKIEGFKGKKRDIILPVTALLKVAELKGQNAVITVTGIEMGYYSRPINAEKWQIPPVWRIDLESGETFYINSFTAEPE